MWRLHYQNPETKQWFRFGKPIYSNIIIKDDVLNSSLISLEDIDDNEIYINDEIKDKAKMLQE